MADERVMEKKAGLVFKTASLRVVNLPTAEEYRRQHPEVVTPTGAGSMTPSSSYDNLNATSGSDSENDNAFAAPSPTRFR